MLTIDCKEVLSVQNELLVYVADKVEAIPTLKNRQFTLSTFDDDAMRSLIQVRETKTVTVHSSTCYT